MNQMQILYKSVAMIGAVVSLSVAMLVAEPIQFSEPVSRAVAPDGDFAAAYPLFKKTSVADETVEN